jgi:hypothetical protein
MSMLNLISININIMDMKRHMLTCFSISILVGNERDEISIWIKNRYEKNSEIIIIKRGSYQERNEIDKLGNEIIIFGNICAINQG